MALTDRGTAWGVALFSVCTDLVLWTTMGTRHGQDTVQFLSGATHLLDGQPLAGKEPSCVATSP